MIDPKEKMIAESDDYLFKNFISLSEAEIRLVYEWRNHEAIRKWMYHADFIDYRQHIRFIQNLAYVSDAAYWMIYYQDKPIGAVYLTDIDTCAETAEIGFYYRPDCDNQFLFGLDFVYRLYFFVFHILEFQVLYGGILCENKDSLYLSLYMGARLEGKKTVNGREYYTVKTLRPDFDTEMELKKDVKEYLKFIREQLKRSIDGK